VRGSGQGSAIRTGGAATSSRETQTLEPKAALLCHGFLTPDGEASAGQAAGAAKEAVVQLSVCSQGPGQECCTTV